MDFVDLLCCAASNYVSQILVLSVQQADGTHLEGLFFILMVHKVKLTWLCKWTKMQK